MAVVASAATPQSATSISLSWTASTDASGIKHYLVYMNGTLKTTVTGTSATITGLSPSTTYTFTVRAVDNADNQSANSTLAEATTPTVPDTTAPVITVTGVTNGATYTSPVTASASSRSASSAARAPCRMR